jgi:hypothetical protein
MAIIEVIKNGYENGGVAVIRNDKHIMLRYLLLVPNMAFGNVDSTKLPLDNHIVQILNRVKSDDRRNSAIRRSQALERNKRRE